MRSNARGLVQRGGLPGWLEEIEIAGVILFVMNGPYVPSTFPVPYRLP
jgi:hypothetical protein